MAAANIYNQIANSTITYNEFSQYGGTSAYQGYFILTANNGYYFPDVSDTAVNVTANTQYKVLYGNNYPVGLSYVSETRDNNGNCIAIRFSSRGYQVSESIFANTWNLSGLITPLIQPIEVTLNVNNVYCSISGVPSNVYTDTILNITATARNNYKFFNTPVLTFTDTNNNPISINATLSNNNTVASFSNIDLSQYDLNENSVLTITATAENTALNFNEVLQNCTLVLTPSEIYKNTTNAVIQVNANTNYLFLAAPYLTFTDTNNVTHTINFIIGYSQKYATANVDFSQYSLTDGQTITVNATATGETPTDTITLETDLQNCTISGVPQYIYTDTILNLTITANTDYNFTVAPQIYFLDTLGIGNVINATLSNNNTVANFSNIDLSQYDLDENSVLELTAIANAITPYIEKYGTINVYKVTENNLKDFAQLRFFKEKEGSTDVDGGYFENIDLGKFVHSIKRFYCNIGNTLNAVLKCGNYNTNIQVQTPENDNITLNCGSVTLPYKNNDITDYQTEINLFLPFVGFVSLNNDYLGKTFTLQYICNLITANTIIKLISDGVTYEFYECNLANDIIYKQSETPFNISTFGNVDFNLQVLKGLTPFVIIKYFETENNKLYNNENKRLQINNIIGFAQVTEITNFVNDFITLTEYELVLSELENGVFVLEV